MNSCALQKIVVTTADWDAVTGRLHCFQRASTQTPWQICLGPFEVVVGQKGLAWGRGLHRNLTTAPLKREGDGKGPAGIFPLRACFGRQPARQLKMDYLELTPTLEAVDDPSSSYYNQIVDRALIHQPDWRSAEIMAEVDLYEWGVVIDHNYPNPIPGAGSAIFMHAWRNNREGTGGCTAMAPDQMIQICHWLDKTKHPILIQVPDYFLTRVF